MPSESISIEGGRLAIPPADGEGVRSFKGIPYAAPPVGALRWRPPQSVLPWPGVRPGHEFGWNSLQGVVFDDIDPSVPGVSEDCLYLNVWTAATPGEERNLQVLFWIHGGGFVVGSGAEPRYDGSRLATKGIVVVTVNHRLGALGFLAHPELTSESGASGNWGLLDLTAALKWVQRNIGAFGGDPAAVTIAGESAGSMAVSALMASPSAKGLFCRAIGQSGAMFASPSRAPATLAEAEQRGLAFARDVGARSLAELRAAPAEAILAAAPGLGLGFRPIVDGHFLPRSPAEIFAGGEQHDVPLLAGWNKDEGFNFTLLQGENADRRYPDLVRELFGDRAEACFALYPSGATEIDEASARALGGHLTIIHGSWAWIEAQKQTGRADIFRFRFERAPLTPQGWFGNRPSSEAGAFHAGELLYVFDNLHAFPWLYTPEDHVITALASSYWINFVKSGNPNGAGLPAWPTYRSEALVMGIDANPAPMPDAERERQDFLASVVAGQKAATGR
jgi:para-nitrobenzyl esterase